MKTGSPHRCALAAAFALALCGAIGVVALYAQSPPQTASPAPSFEAAVVKPANPDSTADAPLGMRMGFMPLPGGRFIARNVTLLMMIGAAWQAKGSKQIAGAPKWAASDRFDIEAKAADMPGRLPTFQWQLMLRSLLADRFQLAVHQEVRTLPVFALVLAKPGVIGPGLHADREPCADALTGGAQTQTAPSSMQTVPCAGVRLAPAGAASWSLAGSHATVTSLAATLAGMNVVDRPILDDSGLHGTFDFDVAIAPPAVGPSGIPDFSLSVSPDASGLPSIFTVLRDQLGLKLKPATGPLQVIVIDRVERPAAN